MKALVEWFKGLLLDEKSSPSSKRFLGLIAGLALCVKIFYTGNEPSETVINAVLMLAFGCLGLTSIDKIFTKKDNKED